MPLLYRPKVTGSFLAISYYDLPVRESVIGGYQLSGLRYVYKTGKLPIYCLTKSRTS